MFFVNVRCCSANIMEVTAMDGDVAVMRQMLSSKDVKVLRDALTEALLFSEGMCEHGVTATIVEYGEDG